jgi:hypothetical protein
VNMRSQSSHLFGRWDNPAGSQVGVLAYLGGDAAGGSRLCRLGDEIAREMSLASCRKRSPGSRGRQPGPPAAQLVYDVMQADLIEEYALHPIADAIRGVQLPRDHRLQCGGFDENGFPLDP